MRPALLLSTVPDTREAEELVASLGLALRGVITQVRSRPDPGTYLGRGKLEEVRDRVERERDPLVAGGSPLVVVNADLRPPQVFNIEDIVGVEVWDRLRLILEIFTTKAELKEARLQVELARLRYELPLLREALHRLKKGERAGYMGGGEVEIRTHETHVRRRTRVIQAELEGVKRERRTRRAGRKKGGFQLVAIAGYTNSGKSSLLNALTASQALVENKAFSTLSTTTRRLRREFVPHRPFNLLFTDTVGFIRNLPPWLIDAFASTLEEIAFADVVLLVVDANESVHLVQEKVETGLDLLHEIEAPPRVVLLFNKADLLDASKRRLLEQGIAHRPFYHKYPHLYTSTASGENLQRLVALLLEEVLPSKQADVFLHPGQSGHAALLHWIYDHADVLREEPVDGGRVVRVRCSLEAWGPLLREAQKAEARVQETGSTGSQGGTGLKSRPPLAPP